MVLFSFPHSFNLELPAQRKRKPVDNLNNGNKTESKTKSAEAAKARDEVHPSHFWRSFKFWIERFQGKQQHEQVTEYC